VGAYLQFESQKVYSIMNINGPPPSVYVNSPTLRVSLLNLLLLLQAVNMIVRLEVQVQEGTGIESRSFIQRL
jgi:hypothetical protein